VEARRPHLVELAEVGSLRLASAADPAVWCIRHPVGTRMPMPTAMALGLLALRIALDGLVISDYQKGGRVYEVRIRLPRARIDSLALFLAFVVTSVQCESPRNPEHGTRAGYWGRHGSQPQMVC